MSRFRQYQTAITCSLTSFLMGLMYVWPSYTATLYTHQNTTILDEPMTEFHESLLGSVPSIGAMVGTAITSLIIDSLGRKNGGIVLALPFAVSWALVDISTSARMILIARFLGGIAGGATLVYGPIFISEIAEDSIRGTLAAGPVICYCVGATGSYVLGWACGYRTVIYINLAASVICAALLTVIVESPVYLLKKNKQEEALKSIAQYRGANVESKQVLAEYSRLKQLLTPAVQMITISEADSETKANSDPENEKLHTDEVVYDDRPKMPAWKTLFVSPSSRRALIVVGSVLTFQIFMGMITVQVYAKKLFDKAAHSLSSDLCSVLFALVLLGGALFTAVFADKAGRRILQISSSLIVAVCMALLGFLLQTGFGPPWISAVLLFVYCFCFSYGAGTVPYVLLAECFKSEVQGIASMLLIEWVWFLNFVLIALFPIMSNLIGFHGVFYIYACVAVGNSIFSFFMLPETKGLSQEQIQESFLRKSAHRKSLY